MASTPLAQPAHFVKVPAPRPVRTSAKPRREGEYQRQHVIAGSQPCQDEAYDRIDDAEKQHVGAIGGEILEPLGKGVSEVGRFDPADCWRRGVEGERGPRRGFSCRAEADFAPLSWSHPHSIGFRMWSLVAMLPPPEPKVRGPQASRGLTPSPVAGHDGAATHQIAHSTPNRARRGATIDPGLRRRGDTPCVDGKR